MTRWALGAVAIAASPRGPSAACLVALAAFGLACGRAELPARPDLLLVVLDTVRADAVSALDPSTGSTPRLDALAASGLLYRRAFAGGPWTLPSHANLFTGLPPEEHGVGVRGSVVAAEQLVTMAERLRDLGYETAGFSENPVVGPEFGLDQGFQHFEVVEKSRPGFPVLARIESWLSGRDRTRPWFVFVNLFDAHLPYEVRPEALPPGVDVARAAAVKQSVFRICGRLPPPEELEILRALYKAEVGAADAQLGAIHDRLVRASGPGRLLTVVTSDHGEHLGERRLLDHQFSLDQVLLHVPLVVHGLPRVAPAVIDAPVELGDLLPSVLAWVDAPADPDLPGRRLPEAPTDAMPDRPMIASYSDAHRSDWPEEAGGAVFASIPPVMRGACGPQDRVMGEMLSWVRYPLKLIRFERYPSSLFDLSWDPRERSDLADVNPELRSTLEAEADAYLARTGLWPKPGAEAPALTPEARAVLEALGYLETGTP